MQGLNKKTWRKDNTLFSSTSKRRLDKELNKTKEEDNNNNKEFAESELRRLLSLL